MKLAAIATLLVLAAGTQVARDARFAPSRIDASVLYVQSGELLSRMALSYDAVLADVYWIRALQHYGRERLKPAGERQFDQLYPLLEIATTLDPLFSVGYRFGAIFLAEPHPGGAGKPEHAIRLLERGIAVNPDKWDYYHDIGFVYYWNLHDYGKAAEWFERGSNIPGAPWWLKTYAAIMLTRGGDRQASRAMWMQMRDNLENDWLRETAHLRLSQLDALDQIDELERRIQEFERRTGRLPETWEEMIAAGLLSGRPVDPAGVPYVLDPRTGFVNVMDESPLHPLPTEPAAAPELKAPQAQSPGAQQ